MVEKISTSQQAAYERIHASPQFQELRKRYLGFAFPMTVAFMVWYLTYVVCSNWASGFMNTKLIGNVNVALVFGLLQFASTFLIAALYARHANRNLDPLAMRLRNEYDEVDR